VRRWHGWCRWSCGAAGNESHDSPLSNEEIRHLRKAACLVCCRPLCCSPSTVSPLSTSSTSTFSTSRDLFLKIQRLTIFYLWRERCPYRMCKNVGREVALCHWFSYSSTTGTSRFGCCATATHSESWIQCATAFGWRTSRPEGAALIDARSVNAKRTFVVRRRL